MKPRKEDKTRVPREEQNRSRFRIERLEERIAPTHKGGGHGQQQPDPDCHPRLGCGCQGRSCL
jgi:hypothetical protein